MTNHTLTCLVILAMTSVGGHALAQEPPQDDRQPPAAAPETEAGPEETEVDEPQEGEPVEAPTDGEAETEAEPAPEEEPTASEAETPEPPRPTRETACDDREDDDGDGLVDCADSDCFGVPRCEAGGNPERNDARCSDWVDNDGDGAIDCEDDDCNGPGVTVCDGSWTGGTTEGTHPGSTADDDLPELTGDMTVEDLIGNYGDNDGERNDYLCSDGIDNDQDGRADCSDFGCRFDPSVTVCQDSPGVRFSVVAGVGASYFPDEDNSGQQFDARFTRIQLRALGQIPLIEDSFFLLSTRWEKTPRLVFAHFQVPIADTGLFAALNSGSGGLSTGLIISSSKLPLLDRPFYLYNAFEQGNGAQLELGGALDEASKFRFRVFASGGAGDFTGNVGGRRFASGEEVDANFAWNAGAQLHYNAIGYFDRFDSGMLYTPEPLTLGFMIGAKYDQRPRERYPAAHAYTTFSYGRLLLRGESYLKRELEFGAWQLSWNALATFLAVPRTILLAADVGQFEAGEFDEPPNFEGSLRRPLDEWQWRVAAHWYAYRNMIVVSALYSEGHIEENPDRPEDPTVEREIRLETQFRF